MKVVFNKRENGPESLVSEPEIVFDGECGPLAGCKIVGFSIWRSAEGELYVTMPSRAFGAGTDRRFYDYIRNAGDDVSGVKNLKAWILDEYRKTSC